MRPNGNTIQIEAVATKEGGIDMPDTLEHSIEKLQGELDQNNADVKVNATRKGATLTGDKAQLDRVAQLLQQASGDHLSSDYVNAMKHTGFFSWQDRVEKPEAAPEASADEERSCFVQ